LVLFASVGYINSSPVQGHRRLARPNLSVKLQNNLVARSESLFKNGHHHFARRPIVKKK